MSKLEEYEKAKSSISRILGCKWTPECNLDCENCPSNYSDEEFNDSLMLALSLIREKERELQNEILV